MSASSFSAGAVPSEGAPPSTPTTCPICLDSTLDVDCAGWAGPRGCAHRGCRACVSAYWTHAIEVDGVAFPGCFFSGCPTVAATDDVVAIVGLRVTARLTYLRSRLATRTVAGEGLWCAAPRCWEPLPPLAAPPPPPPLPSPSPGSGPVAEEAARLPSTGTRGGDRSPPPPQAADAARLPSPPPSSLMSFRRPLRGSPPPRGRPSCAPAARHSRVAAAGRPPTTATARWPSYTPRRRRRTSPGLLALPARAPTAAPPPCARAGATRCRAVTATAATTFARFRRRTKCGSGSSPCGTPMAVSVVVPLPTPSVRTAAPR
ncbi:hypothetical protein BU14_0166s0032 [Porphyra umbilicalis]|uniref:Uncharacterized protein n=1 Tax=Porphyra umbilicalis TaxID=2786 RepID=A0A1X6P7X6_PORUM|nr:hypothetical protein BU14_0166s0032 [Porphyra umbilicalis]|eukprot:OSX76992.1 hypothetical protein BU14_0166s0032 [Porphyra umbilicalis]